MKTMLTSILALVAALAFAGANVTASAEEKVSTTSPQHGQAQHGQAQMTPDTTAKAESSGKRAKAKNKKAKKAKKQAKKSRKAQLPED